MNGRMVHVDNIERFVLMSKRVVMYNQLAQPSNMLAEFVDTSLSSQQPSTQCTKLCFVMTGSHAVWTFARTVSFTIAWEHNISSKAICNCISFVAAYLHAGIYPMLSIHHHLESDHTLFKHLRCTWNLCMLYATFSLSSFMIDASKYKCYRARAPH